MKKLLLNAVLIIFVLIFSQKGLFAADRLSLSVEKLKLENKERITGFKVTITNGYVTTVKNIPIGWYISIDPFPGTDTNVIGNIRDGNAALDTNILKDFLIIEPFPLLFPKEQPSFNVEVEISTTIDFVKFKPIVFKMKDLNLTKVGE